MNRIATVTTKVRPLKKLYVIEPDDWQTFNSIIGTLTEEVSGASNLILLDDAQLLDQNTRAFVLDCDPDLIINHSKHSTDGLQASFGIPSRVYDKIRPVDVGIALRWWDQIPETLYDHEIPKHLYTHLGDVTSLEQQMIAAQFGHTNRENFADMHFSLVENSSLEHVGSQLKFWEVFWGEGDENLLLMSEVFNHSRHYGSDIWTIDYNPDDYFSRSPTIIVGPSQDLKAAAYFWNMRAAYPFNKTAWVPYELLETSRAHLSAFTHCVDFTEGLAGLALLRTCNPEIIPIPAQRYYFKNSGGDWARYEHIQNVAVHDGKFRVQHPHEKLFSGMGFNAGFVFELRGIEDLFIPTSATAGELFKQRYDARIATHSFSRISKNGLSFYASDFEPSGAEDIIHEITVPDATAILRAVFHEHGFRIEETPETRVARQVLNLLNEEGLGTLLRDPAVHQLLVKMTPPRTERIAKRISQELLRQLPPDTMTQEAVVQEAVRSGLAGILGSVETINSEVVLDLEAMASRASVSALERGQFFDNVQRLYQASVLLRGKSFQCPHCHLRVWFPLQSIDTRLRCYGCDSTIAIPIAAGGRIVSDAFRLNELVSNAVDQGVLPLLYVIDFLKAQKYYAFRTLYNCDIFADQNREAEVDLIFTLARRLGLAEIKADRGFEVPQLDRLLNLAKNVRADLLLFASLRNKDHEDIKSLILHLKGKNLDIPAFILTRETLLSTSSASIAKYFEVGRGDSFRVGPIVI